MAMDLDTAKADIKTATQDAAFAMWGSPEATYEAFADFADVIADACVAALQHILDNAETDPSGEGIL